MKSDVVAEIASLLGVPAPHMSTGSTEPKEIFELVNNVLGLGLDPQLTKPDLAAAISNAAGLQWAPKCESSGGTVTMEGLETVREAVIFFLGSS